MINEFEEIGCNISGDIKLQNHIVEDFDRGEKCENTEIGSNATGNLESREKNC